MEALMITFTCGAIIAVAGLIVDAMNRRDERRHRDASK